MLCGCERTHAVICCIFRPFRARVKQTSPRNTKKLASQRGATQAAAQTPTGKPDKKKRKHRYRPGALALR